MPKSPSSSPLSENPSFFNFRWRLLNPVGYGRKSPTGRSPRFSGPPRRVPLRRPGVSHPSRRHSTFGDLKKYLAQKTGLEADELKLLFRGKEKEDEEQMDMAGVKDNSKVMLLEVPKEREVGELNETTEMECDVGDNGVESNEVPFDAGEVGVDSPEI